MCQRGGSFWYGLPRARERCCVDHHSPGVFRLGYEAAVPDDAAVREAWSQADSALFYSPFRVFVGFQW